MKVTLGYSREHPGGTKWSKADVMLEEEDLKRLLIDNGIDPTIQVKANLVFQLLNAEGEIYLLAKQKSEGLVSAEDAVAHATTLREYQNKLIAEIKGEGK